MPQMNTATKDMTTKIVAKYKTRMVCQVEKYICYAKELICYQNAFLPCIFKKLSVPLQAKFLNDDDDRLWEELTNNYTAITR